MQTQLSDAPAPERRDSAASGRCSKPAIVRPAIVDSFRKLDPRVQARNPVMFVVLVGSVLTTVPVLPRPRLGHASAERVHGLGRRVAVVHRAVRQLRRGDGRRSRQGAGGHAAQDPSRDDGEPAAARRRHRGGAVVAAHRRRRRRRVGGRDDPVGRRDHRGHRVGRRVGHHRRVGAGHPRSRRRPLGGHRRHPCALRPDRRAHHRPAGRDVPRPDDRARRRARTGRRRRTRSRSTRCSRCSRSSSCWRRPPCSRSRSFAGAEQKIVVLVALLVCLIPTTIGALLSAIGIAGMDRLVQHNVLAMSGRAVEAAGDCSTLLLDKTGTITLGNRQAAQFLAACRHLRGAAGRGRAAREPGRRDARRAARSSCWPRSASTSASGT